MNTKSDVILIKNDKNGSSFFNLSLYQRIIDDRKKRGISVDETFIKKIKNIYSSELLSH